MRANALCGYAESLLFHTHPEADLALTDVVTANASATKHGLLPKLSGVFSDALRGDGTWGYPGAIPVTNSAGGGLTAGDPVVWSNNGPGKVASSNVFADRRAAGVLVTGGNFGETVYMAPYGSKCTVNTTGTVLVGDALYCSTVHRYATAYGTGNRPGFLGYALTASGTSGLGTVTAIICPAYDRYGLGVTADTAALVYALAADGAPANFSNYSLDCGLTGYNKAVVCLAGFAGGSSAAFTPPTFASQAMTEIATSNSTLWSNSSPTACFIKGYKTLTQLTGSQAAYFGSWGGTGTGNNAAFVTMFALANAGAISTPNIQIFNTATAAPSVTFQNVNPGDTLVAMLVIDNLANYATSFITGVGSNQSRISWAAYTAATHDILGDCNIKEARAFTETMSWTLNAAVKCAVISMVIPPF
jgi:hypothetical protein